MYLEESINERELNRTIRGYKNDNYFGATKKA